MPLVFKSYIIIRTIMHKKNFYSLTILLCLLIPITITANPVSLTGKRYFNVSYGLSQQEKNDNEISLARLTINLPITRKLDLSFGTFQGWMDETINENNIKTQHDYSFYINSKYHFLPQSIINPFVIIEMGQVINDIKIDSTQESSSENTNINSKGILFTNTDSINTTYTSIQYYYSLALGEELTIKDKTSISMFYNLGSINNTSYQQFVASIGYWILTDILLDFQIKSHINQSLTEYHLVSNIKF